ncbi:glycosyltransferase family 61 protein [Vibrio nitrifigilis]|uniref:Glycosyltransferase family 61 protein n=1 Tax=Vibrio nitrifigilis TaxID=2789781 RepID=A0ABS0GFF0_9VIBR|nr:glycosyltransferase family 61 protein [Vibrio nitrifigilis]MBF9001157.1 glycosyltransferase family 61 protein [Vibrio nitrifigilis]
MNLNKIKKIIYLLITAFFLLFPKFIRDQYWQTKELYIFWAGKVYRHIKSCFLTKYKLVDNIEKLDCIDKCLFFNKSKNFFNKISPSSYYINKKQLNSQSVVIHTAESFGYLLKNVTIICDSDAFIYKNYIYSHEINRHYSFHEMKADNIQKYDENNNYVIKNKIKSNTDNQKLYVSLLTEVSYNYWHWSFEILTKLIKLNESINNIPYKKNDIVLVVDSKIPNQFKRSLDILNKNNFEVLLLDNSQALSCNNVLYISNLNMIINNRQYTSRPELDFYSDRSSLISLREEVLESERNITFVNKPKRVFIYRAIGLGAHNRSIANYEELIYTLYKYEFTMINVFTLTYDEQIELFANAEIIVGMAGAEFVNLIYMHSGANVIMINPATAAASFYSFQYLADISNVNLKYFMSNSSNLNNIHSESSVNVKYFENLLKETCENYFE